MAFAIRPPGPPREAIWPPPNQKRERMTLPDPVRTTLWASHPMSSGPPASPVRAQTIVACSGSASLASVTPRLAGSTKRIAPLRSRLPMYSSTIEVWPT